MHTSKDDYLINTLSFVFAKEETQIYCAILLQSLTSPEMKETKAYMTYLGFATGATPPKKSKRVKRPTKKSTQAPTRGVVIRETPERQVSKKKEKVDVSRAESWGNDKDNNNNDQDSSSEGSDQDKDNDDDKTQSNNEDESEFKHETDENESGSESDQEEYEEKIEDDKEEEEEELVKTPSKDSDDEDETKIADKVKGDEDEEMDYTTSQLYDDVDIRLNELVDTDKGFVQEEGTDAAMTNVQQGNENPKILQVKEDAHAAKFLNFSDILITKVEIISPMDVHVHHEVPSKQTPTLLTIPISVITDSSPIYTTVIPQSLPSFTPPPQHSTSTPPPTTKATNTPSTLPDFASVFQFNNRVTALEQEIVELKKDPLRTQVTALVDEHIDARLGASRDEFMNFLSASLCNTPPNLHWVAQ
ncbi:hypothetical protein Tco_0196471 [Tanacetum coccineum]